jgi:hypothetical protein
MADDQEFTAVAKRLEKYGMAIARRVLRKFDLEFDTHWQEDIGQSLLLEGWKVWRDTGGNEGLARHRMRTRAKTEVKKLFRTLKQPRPNSAFTPPAVDGTWDWSEDAEAAPLETTERPFRRLSIAPDVKSDVLDQVAAKDYFAHLPEPRRKVARCRAAGMSVEEMVEETGLNRRAVERELQELKGELEDAKDDE